MTNIRYILHMNNGIIKILYSKLDVELLQGQYKSVKVEKLTNEGWKEIEGTGRICYGTLVVL